MKLNQEGVEKAARAIWRTEWGETVFPDETGIEYEELCAKATAALTAYFDHLREAGLMREGRGWDHSGSGYWSATTSGASMLPNDFIALILRTEKE